jgi:hypothetical protein
MFYEGGAEPVLAGESIPLLRGSVFYPKDGQDRYSLASAPDLVTSQRGDTNRMEVRVDWLTGRAKIFKPWEQTAAWK